MFSVRDPPPDLGRLFQQLAAQEGGIRPVALPRAYLRALQEIEDLPCNQPGQDKSWVLRAERRERDILEDSQRLT